MVAFAATLGFAFMAHRVGDPDRKGRVERPFFYVQMNFLPGRTFADFDDLNTQALRWCVEVANAKPKRDLGQSAEDAYRQELAYLRSNSCCCAASTRCCSATRQRSRRARTVTACARCAVCCRSSAPTRASRSWPRYSKR